MNNLSSTFTIDDLREIAYRGSYGDSERALARELLALREAAKTPYAITTESEMLHVRHGSNGYIMNVSRIGNFSDVIPLFAAPQLPAVPEGAEERLAAAVETLKQAAPHMLADESMKDPDGVLCGKRVIPDQLTIDDATAKLSVEYSLSNTGVTAFRDGWNACVAAIAAAPQNRPQNIPEIIPDGWVMVPRKITLEMECALSRADSYEIGWQYAIAAAPKPEVGGLDIGSGISPGVHSSSVTKSETFEQWLSKQPDGIDVDCGCVTTEAFYHWLRVAYNANR